MQLFLAKAARDNRAHRLDFDVDAGKRLAAGRSERPKDPDLKGVLLTHREIRRA